MGLFFGRRPDRTASIARGVRGHLASGEEVIAGVHVQVPGTLAAGMAGAASGAQAGALDVAVTLSDAGGAEGARWRQEAAEVGYVDRRPSRGMLLLVLTTARVLLVHRSLFLGRALNLAGNWPIAAVDRIEVPSNGSSLKLRFTSGADLILELPHAHRFLPDVYRALPQLLRRCQQNIR